MARERPINSPAVSVCVVTYNHERYLAQALDGVLMQRTAFPFEIVIGEDCSTDGTRAIARRYAAAHPQTITLIEREKNVGGNRNFALALQRCRGRYVALLDGDDYWTSSHKLQRQFDFLETRPQYVVCFHAVKVIQESVPPRTWLSRPAVIRETYTLRDLLRRYEFQTGSAMVRSAAIPPLPRWYSSLKVGDVPLFAMLAEHGSLGFIDESMGVYRVHVGGLWSGKDRIGQHLQKLPAYEALSRYFRHEHDCVMWPDLAHVCVDLARRYEARGEFGPARAYLMRGLSWGAWRLPGRQMLLGRMLLRFYLPAVYRAVRAAYRSARGRAAQAGNS